ncbi:MAG: DUF3108 domain-containing protein [Cyclobacteriaceae bacterium]
MKKLTTILLLFSLFAFTSINQQGEKKENNLSFKQGEEIKYKMSYGFISVGEGIFSIDRSLHTKHGKTCYKVSIHGSTSNFFNKFLKVEDKWVSHVDTATMQPVEFFRDITEGKYTRLEYTTFNHDTGAATVKYKRKQDAWKTKQYDTGLGIDDMGSLYANLRNIDYSKMKKGDKISVSMFLDDQVYKAQLYYRGREILKTKLGEFKTIKLAPKLPNTEIFDGKDAASLWITDDPNHILLEVKVKVDVSILHGNAWLEVQKIKGNKYPLTSKVK